MPLDGDPCAHAEWAIYAQARARRRSIFEGRGFAAGVPAGSSQETSAIAHSVFLGSISRPSMPSVSAVLRAGLVTWG